MFAKLYYSLLMPVAISAISFIVNQKELIEYKKETEVEFQTLRKQMRFLEAKNKYRENDSSKTSYKL